MGRIACMQFTLNTKQTYLFKNAWSIELKWKKRKQHSTLEYQLVNPHDHATDWGLQLAVTAQHYEGVLYHYC